MNNSLGVNIFSFLCICNEASFQIGDFSDPNSFVFLEEVVNEDLTEEMALKMVDRLKGRSIDYFVSNDHDFLRDMLLSPVNEFVKCPKCGRIHVFWTKNDKIIRSTYQPEFEDAYGEGTGLTKIQVPYNNSRINQGI